jgi:hypothetical protein
MMATTVALYVTTIGLERTPCDPGLACGLLSYSVFTGPEVAAMLFLAALPLLLTVSSRLAFRAAGVLGAIGVQFLAWISVFDWGARFTYGGQLVFLNGDAETPFLVLWLLGAMAVGAAIAVFGCLRTTRDSQRSFQVSNSRLGSTDR